MTAKVNVTVNLIPIGLFILLLHCAVYTSSPTVSAEIIDSNFYNETTANKDIRQHCLVVFENVTIKKDVGARWISLEHPCDIHACDIDETGKGTKISVRHEDCSEFYCSIGSEVQPMKGVCCGVCVQTKCEFNGTAYAIGQTWHNNEDCTLLECAKLANGQPIINAYQKTCPPFPKNCPKESIYTEDCCQYCSSTRSLDEKEEIEDIWTEDFYRNHPCARICQKNAPPMTCHYRFVVEWYQTLSKACYDCPKNITDCERPHCIVGDGITRSITVVNRMMPGPSIEVCENDIIIVDVKNDLLGESTTIHWHGLHQRETPYMDGVPHITQCPIAPHTTFRYTFRADNPGTHFWHSHTGMQRGDGVFGALIIRRPRAEDPHAHLYDFDLSEHKMIVQDWVHVPGVTIFADHHHSRGDNKPRNLLINGRGRFYYAIWDNLKSHSLPRIASPNATNLETSTSSTKSTTTTHTPEVPVAKDFSTEVNRTPNTSDLDIDFYQPFDNVGRISYKDRNDLLRLARLVNSGNLENSDYTFAQTDHDTGTNITLERSRRSTENTTVLLEAMPHQVYNVKGGYRYRFRIINAEFLNCPIAISIDNHTLTAINSDGYDFEAVEVGSIVTYAGERFDFVVHANQPVANYWIRLKGLMDCSELFTSAFQVAIFHYETASFEEPTATLGYAHKVEGIELNVMNRGPGYVDSLTVAELTALPSYDIILGIDRDALKPVADYKFFIYYDFYAKDNPVFHPASYYAFNDTVEKTNRLFTPQLNHISLEFPSLPLLPSRYEIDDASFCNETSLEAKGIDCRKQFCKCHHVLQVPLGAIIEFIIVDEGFTFDANHPFHLHGNAFRVVALERLGQNVTVEMVKQLDRFNLLKRNLIRPPVKDTVTVPDGGYTIVRFKATNPGFWLFHCHIEFHAEIGMALVLKVGENNEMAHVPKNFPTCHDYMPDDKGDDPTNNGGLPSSSSTIKPDENNSNLLNGNSVFLYLIVTFTFLLQRS